MAVSPDDATVASASEDGTVRLWRLKDGAAIAALGLAGPPGAWLEDRWGPPVESVAFDETGGLYACGNGHLDARGWAASNIFDAWGRRDWSAGGVDGWDRLVEGCPLRHAPGEEPRVLAARANVVATGGGSGGVWLWRGLDDEVAGLAIAKRAADARLEAHRATPAVRDPAQRATRAAKGEELAAVAAAATAALSEKAKLGDLEHGHAKATTDLSFSNEGDRLLSASVGDATACVWAWGADAAGRAVAPSRLIMNVGGPDEELTAAAWTSDDAFRRPRGNPAFERRPPSRRLDRGTLFDPQVDLLRVVGSAGPAPAHADVRFVLRESRPEVRGARRYRGPERRLAALSPSRERTNPAAKRKVKPKDAQATPRF